MPQLGGAQLAGAGMDWCLRNIAMGIMSIAQNQTEFDSITAAPVHDVVFHVVMIMEGSVCIVVRAAEVEP